MYEGTNGTVGSLYLGSSIYERKISGVISLESAGWEGGRILPKNSTDNLIYQITDHLGSVRAVRRGNGTVERRFDYYPFGSDSRHWEWVDAVQAGGFTPAGTAEVQGGGGFDTDLTFLGARAATGRWRFGGKEIAGQKAGASALAGIPAAAAGRPYLDFGARLYDPRTAAWLSQDPMAEKYYPISPYAYCSNDPLNRFDPDGRADFKKIGWGLFNASTGLATAIGGGFVTVGSSGTAGLLGGAMISEGIVQIGLGLTQVILGFADDRVPEEVNVPSTSLGAVGMALDEIQDTGTHTFETAGNLVTSVVTMSNPSTAKSKFETVIGLVSQLQVVLTSETFIESFSSQEAQQTYSAPAIDNQTIDWQEELIKYMIWKP